MAAMKSLSTMFVSLFVAGVCHGAEPCREGEKRLHPDETCIPAPLASYLYCLEKSGGGKIEVKKKQNSDSTNQRQFDLTVGVGNLVFSARTNGGLSMSDSERLANEVHEKLDPELAKNCKALVPSRSGRWAPEQVATKIVERPKRAGPATPIPGDVIANFRGTKGTGALTSNGLQFSLMSDSSLNMGSKVWYERIQDSAEKGDGYLVVHYQILPTPGREGFVGIYADFTLPPPKPVSLERFQGVSIKLRARQDVDALPEVRFVLYSDNIENMQYAYPIARVQPDGEWREFNIPFRRFEAPPHAISPVRLDPGRVFRFAFVLVSDRQIHGHIDISEIKLF